MGIDRRRRMLEEKVFKALMLASISLVAASLFLVVATIVWKGAPAMTLSMVTRTSSGGYYLGGEGGILNAIVGSLLLAGGSSVLALLLSLPAALALRRGYLGGTRIGSLLRLAFDVLWGIPSIVYGAFGFIIMLALGMRASLLGGIIALTLLQLPIMVRSMDEVMRMVPRDLKDASYALGATRLETSGIIVRQAMPGIINAVILALGRGIGDAASIMFTAGYSDAIPSSLSSPVASLPLAIFFQMQTPFPEVRQRAYASAFILLVILLALGVASRALSKKFLERNVIR